MSGSLSDTEQAGQRGAKPDRAHGSVGGSLRGPIAGHGCFRREPGAGSRSKKRRKTAPIRPLPRPSAGGSFGEKLPYCNRMRPPHESIAAAASRRRVGPGRIAYGYGIPQHQVHRASLPAARSFQGRLRGSGPSGSARPTGVDGWKAAFYFFSAIQHTIASDA